MKMNAETHQIDMGCYHTYLRFSLLRNPIWFYRQFTGRLGEGYSTWAVSKMGDTREAAIANAMRAMRDIIKTYPNTISPYSKVVL